MFLQSPADGEIEIRRIDSLRQAASTAPVVVNCAGMGARDLVPDLELIPVRGQLVVVENPGITEFFSEETGHSSDLLHYYPQGDAVVFGGASQTGAWGRDPDPRTAEAIIDRCAQVEPRLRRARVLEHRVGLRPTRPCIRLEQERLGGLCVIHNYGHGGAGVSLSWGCALEVAACS
ncbi:FAD-dependent oxidoreductase [Micromonospora craniellae]|uniref:FAD-dependent oxidoreductase n=1 Tax=Micromonospora craniellae TaxID=2294034 RepID=UPI0021E0471C|nr:FAD-dependent oxidoreductase [Micromonospora craniellae]